MTKTEKDRDLVRRCIVERWALLARGEETVPGCALCQEYGGVQAYCKSCPIQEKTGRRECGGTPYDEWRRNPTAVSARAELDFLWDLHDDLTGRILVEPNRESKKRRGKCYACGQVKLCVWVDDDGDTATRICDACREAKGAAGKLDGESVTIERCADDEQKLNTPVDEIDIAAAIHREHGVSPRVPMGDLASELGLYDVVVRFGEHAEATVKVWVVEGDEEPKRKSKHAPCVVCGAMDADTDLEARVDHGKMVCGHCARECYDADGRYLVPVVRGGPWRWDGESWEVWDNGEWTSYCCNGYTIGKVEVLSRAGIGVAVRCLSVDIRAPRGYTGPLPEGCRWAEGSEPKPYKVLEGSVDGELWFEITRTNAMDAYLRTDARTLHSTRVRTVDAGGKTTWTDETVHKPPKTKAAPDIRPNDRVFVNKISDALNGERGIVVTAQKTIDCYRVVFDDDTVRHYHAVELRLERELTGKAASRITTRAAVVSLGRIVSDIALTLKRDEFRSIKAEEAFTAYDLQAERLLERLAE